MAARRREAIGGQRLGERARGRDEVVGLDGGEAGLRDPLDGSGKVLLEESSEGVQLEGVEHGLSLESWGPAASRQRRGQDPSGATPGLGDSFNVGQLMTMVKQKFVSRRSSLG
ncbi:hypothetical protein SCMU_05750 [Sinomonas cyclohexanicum]|uniref:Uncharacterized protein n=1 Tax=Sinomonas cyclohexanicum TaxID=322009 RepID=A0ABM7PRC4_SINCY|nr:hypothetical protein SCMU_05750 [Corynebacterium cyclohexanicum]